MKIYVFPIDGIGVFGRQILAEQIILTGGLLSRRYAKHLIRVDLGVLPTNKVLNIEIFHIGFIIAFLQGVLIVFLILQGVRAVDVAHLHAGLIVFRDFRLEIVGFWNFVIIRVDDGDTLVKIQVLGLRELLLIIDLNIVATVYIATVDGVVVIFLLLHARVGFPELLRLRPALLVLNRVEQVVNDGSRYFWSVVVDCAGLLVNYYVALVCLHQRLHVQNVLVV